MSQPRKSVKLNVSSFISDYARGRSDEELRDKHALSPQEIEKVVGILRKQGQITAEHLTDRKENLRIRFGIGEEAPAKENERRVAVELDTGFVLHCPSCGASVERGAEKCDYCASPLDFSLKGKTIHCPHCYLKIPADSQFCIRCAKPVKSEVQKGQKLDDRMCPRCRIAMFGQNVGDFTVMACEECRGLFIPNETFEMMQETSERVIQSTATPYTTKDDGKTDFNINMAYVRCPVCRNMMNRQNFARVSGVIIDACSKHGLWFDAGELERIMDFIAKGGLQTSRQRELERLKHEEQMAKLRRDTNMAGEAGLGIGGGHGYYGGGMFGGSSLDTGIGIGSVLGGLFSIMRD